MGNYLLNASECEIDIELGKWHELLSESGKFSSHDLADFVRIAFQRSMDAAAQSLNKLAHILKDKALHSGGWDFNAIEGGTPWDVMFSASSEKDGGLLVHLQLRSEETEEAIARKQAKYAAATAGMAPEQVREHMASILIDEIMSKDATSITDYKAPTEHSKVREVSIYGYSDGSEPSIFCIDGVQSLEDVVKTAVSNSSIRSKLANSTISWSDELHGSADLYSSASVLDAMKVISHGLDAANLLRETYSHGREIGLRRYPDYYSDKKRAIHQAAQAAVYADSGLGGPITWETAFEIWTTGIQHTFVELEEQLAEVIETLAEHGHNSIECEYSCNDLDNHAHVQLNNDGSGVLWLSGQNGRYGLRFHAGDYGTDKGLYVLSSVSNDVYGMGMTAVDEEFDGYLSTFKRMDFERLDGKPNFQIHRPARFSDRAIKDINNALMLVDTVHCCLRDDYSASLKP